MSVDLDNPGDNWQWAAVIESRTREADAWRARALAAEAFAAECAAFSDAAMFRTWDAESIARRALVEGLAECERLRKLVPYQLPTSNEAQAVVDDVMRANRPQSSTRTVLSRRLDEQAIRADAAREERARVVAWLQEVYEAQVHNDDTCQGVTARIVAAIERGEHAPSAGGEG